MRHNIDHYNNPSYAHKPILWREIISYVKESGFKKDDIFVDCTLGEGGHSEIILKEFNDLKVIAFERDKNILAEAKERLTPFENRIIFINDNFSNISNYSEVTEKKVKFILYDFGISSYHFDKSERGFAFKEDEILDMRLDDSAELSAKDIINKYSESDLADVFFEYGEERRSRKVASVICEKRKEKPIERTGELAEIVKKALYVKPGKSKIHPATKVFQALRIEVNGELEAIRESLDKSYLYVKKGGRIMAMSFHSLEDRIVKNTFKRLSRGCLCEEEPFHCKCENDNFIKIITKKPVTPMDDEVDYNRRSRSAKLRVCERI